MTDKQTPQMLYGVAAIGDHIGVKERQARHMIDCAAITGIPTFKVGGKVCALKGKLDDWMLTKASQKPEKPSLDYKGAL